MTLLNRGQASPRAASAGSLCRQDAGMRGRSFAVGLITFSRSRAQGKHVSRLGKGLCRVTGAVMIAREERTHAGEA
jgi:hypothetical protein